MPTQYFEDIQVDRRTERGRYTVSADEITEFATKYDPQPFHIEEEVAESSHGELIASGLQTLCIANKAVVDAFRRDIASVAGLGIEDLRWKTPVRPGNTLTIHQTIEDKRISETDPSTGVVSERVTVTNDRGDLVLQYNNAYLVERRDED